MLHNLIKARYMITASYNEEKYHIEKLARAAALHLVRLLADDSDLEIVAAPRHEVPSRLGDQQ